VSSYYEYVTLEGDTWDSIALDFYDDEFKSSVLIDANREHVKTIIFPAGIVLKIPIIETKNTSTLPPWKRSE
jgi:hypothetical protein